MATKYEYISRLVQDMKKKVIRSKDSWTSYLDTAARLYKYPFEEQLLIYAQRPDATACASMEIWNQKMYCYVKRGSKGIALIDTDNSKGGRLKYVFDVSDVYKLKNVGRMPNLWTLEKEHQDEVLKQLEKSYGDTTPEYSFASRIREIADIIAADCIEDVLLDIQETKDGSALEHLDGETLREHLQETVSSSIAYTLLARCGVDMTEWKEKLNFDYIQEFNTPKVLLILGNATTDLSKPVLMEIGKTIRNLQKKVLANNTNLRYNALKRESKNEHIDDREGGKSNGTDIRKERGLSDTEPDSGRGTGGNADQVRAVEREIPERASEGNLGSLSAGGQSEAASAYDTGAGRREDGRPDGADEKERGNHGAAERGKPDALGTEDEQYQAGSGGNRAGRADIQVDDKQLNMEKLEPDSMELSGSSFSDNTQASVDFTEIQKGILCSDEFLIHKRPEIAGYFQSEQDMVLQTEYLKNSFRMEEYTEFYIGDARAGYLADEDGLTIWKGNYLTREAESRLSWEDARYWVNTYIEDGVYLLPGEIAEKIDTDGMFKQLDLFAMMTEQVGNIVMKKAEERSVMPTGFVLPEKQLDDILRSGGGRDNSRKRIYAKYQQGKTPEEIADFLKEEYKTTGKGFELAGHPLSVWFDENGMRIGYGTSAKEKTFMVMSWQEVESHIRSMVENGTYMSTNEVFLVDAVERERIATDINNFFRDGILEIPESLELKFSNYPASMERLCELLSTSEGRELIKEELEKAKEQLDRGEKQIKWRYVKRPEYLLGQIADLGVEKKEFPAPDTIEVRNEDFITQDEIDYRLTGGSGFGHGKFRIYEYFMEGHDNKENIEFLKNAYGTGGSSHALPGSDSGHEEHNAKGICLEKGNYGSPYAKVLLNWNVVEKRIRELVQADKYLSPEEKESYAQYKREQAEKAMRKEQENLEKALGEQTLNAEDVQKDVREQVTVAVESTRDFAEPEIGFHTRRHFDGSEEICYRLVTMKEDGFLAAYPEPDKYFTSRELLQEYMDAHKNEIHVIRYDEMVYRSFAKQLMVKQEEQETDIQKPEKEDTPEIKVNEDAVHPENSVPSEEDISREHTVRSERGNVQEAAGPPAQISHSMPEDVQNYRIPDDVGTGAGFSPKEKFRQNVEAIRTLEKIEGESRTATPQEQEILAKYVGWGGLADAFDETKTNWAGEYQELKNLLSPEEYASARESTLNAHYTSPVIIRSIYEALDKMGFEKGNVLEPAVGIGNFFGMLPEKMQESRLYGVELDSITGRIAKQLYPNADIKITGFEKTDFPNDFFDVAVGNVPFGQYKVADRIYDKHNFLIHDYFFAKTLDKVRPGGIVAFVTSKGTMDKQSPAVRKYLAQRAELLGAIRLPNTAFKANAGTEVTSDILFLKKRDRVIDTEPDWVHLTENEDGIAMNQYFADHPEMVLGKMEMVSGPYGMESACIPDTSSSLAEQLQKAISHMEGRMEEAELEELDDELSRESIPASPGVRNYSFTIVDEKLYYRENSIMKPVEVSETAEQRIKGMVRLRDCTQELIDLQLEEYPEEMFREKQEELNKLYDDFSKKYGRICSQTNRRAFNQDSSYCLLCSLEKVDDEGNFKGKADMFTRRTIRKAEVVTSVDTSSEALLVSLGEKAGVDLAYMAELTGKGEEEVAKELTGVIFQNPVTEKWETADEYLSGNVREKLATAKVFAENRPEFAINVSALEKVQPKDLDASEIEVRIGATWIDPKYIEDFMRETFETPEYLFNRDLVGVQYSGVTGQWNIKGKNADRGNTLTNMTYGTGRANAYRILEDSLNLRDIRIFDVIEEDGKEKRVLNKKETMLASQKQEAIREAFKDWIFRNPERRQALCARYNELFNSSRPREYDGSHLKFPGMTPDIILRPHQLNAVAHQLYGNNTLLAHCVGAGKTYEMIAAAMESKRLGLCQKSLFVVPNHLTEQWASDFLRLYPGANILAATKKDFEPANRKKFCSRIATGDYDAVIIGHSQFEKIPLSQERQVAIINRQLDEIETAIAQVKADKGERYTIKQMEKSRKSLLTRLEKLNDASRKDNVVTFEQLGVDRLFVDESHNYKNLFLYTKMRNVAGIAQTEAQKSSDMFAKCQYMDELTGGRGITFATGTPISNSMTELYTNMRYLQYDTLQKLGLGNFDSWAATFGETQTAIELAPEGTGYRAKTRFAKFFNLPELISLFKESADIQTPDMLKLPVPEAEYVNVVLKPSEYQKEMVHSLADRAEAVRDRRVDATVDNMLKITNDGRKLALDQRLIDAMLPDDENSKANTCVDKAFEIWEQTKEQKSTQLIFCDLSTPKGDGTFNVYEDIREKLTAKGVPDEEIAFIHDANTEARKTELFAKVRSGQVRFLLGSTAKMGAGTNVQDRLIALHHLDVPWRPSDIEQQEGRILRQGNCNPKVRIFRYVTEGTFDSYSWQLIENKQKFIGQIMTSKSPVRSCEDIDEAALSYAEVKALATGNPYIKEKMDLDIQVSKLKLLKANHTSQRYRLEDNISQHYPQKITSLKETIEGYRADIQTYAQNKPADKDTFSMKIGNRIYTERKEAGTALIEMCRSVKQPNMAVTIGEYQGFKMSVSFEPFYSKFTVNLKGSLTHAVEIGIDATGNLQRINHVLEGMAGRMEDMEQNLANVEHQLETAKMEVRKPFAQEQELAEKQERLAELNALLNMDEKDDNVISLEEGELEKPEDESEEKQHERAGRVPGPDRGQEMTKDNISYFVAEAMEFHTLGVVYENIATIEEAIHIYENLHEESHNMGNGIGAMVNGDEYSLYENGEVDTLEYYGDDIKNNDAILNAVNVLNEHFSSAEQELNHGDHTRNPFNEKNFKIQSLPDNGGFVVRSDSERFGRNEIVFQGTSYDECLSYIAERVDNITPSYYVIKDLASWRHDVWEKGQMPERSAVERFETVEEAIAKFNEYKGMDYLKEDIINPDNNKLMRRLALGVSYNPVQMTEMDLLHTEADKTLLLSDAIAERENGYESFMTNSKFIQDLNKITSSVTIDEYSYFHDSTMEERVSFADFTPPFLNKGENELVHGEYENITLHIKYQEPIRINGFVVATDEITFDSQEELNNYVNGKPAHNALDDSVMKRDNEILLYAENENGDVVWGTREEQREEPEKTVDDSKDRKAATGEEQETDSVRRIRQQVQLSGHKPTESVVRNIRKLEELTGKEYTVKEMKEAFQKGSLEKDSEAGRTLDQLVKEFRNQEALQLQMQDAATMAP